jgi:hypothetical protein
VWAHRTSRGGQPTPRDTAVYAATGLAFAASVAQTRAMPNPHDMYGLPRVPASLGVRGLAFVTALSRNGLSRRARTTAWVGGAAAVVASWALTPPPRPVREFVAQMSWVGMSAAIAGAFTEGIERDSADLEAWVAEEDARRLSASAEVGRAKALAAVEAALADAEQLYAAHADELAPELRAETRRRLDRCAERLAATHCP